MSKMTPRLALRLAMVGLVTAILVTAPFWLRGVSFFEVRRVQVLGAKYLEPAVIVSALALDSSHNLFDPLVPLEQKIAGVAGVGAVEIERRLPATLRVAIVERVPVAFVPGPDGMIALDSEARPLPYDPASTDLDLPVVAGTDRGLTRALALVRGLDALLYGELTGARRNENGTVEFFFDEQVVLLNSTPSIGDVLKITAVRRHFVETNADYDQLDARFRDQVIARKRRA